MNKNINWLEHRGRVYLKDVLPLDTPLKIEVEPTSACNFRCIYCRHSAVKIKPEFMTMETFDKIIKGIKKFPNKIKSFNFAGVGEPLLNKNIYNMIKKANEVSDNTVLITNGSLLDKNNSNKLIDSEISTIRISLQGLSDIDYYNVAKYKINIETFINNIKYIYQNKKEKTKLYLKMPDISVKTPELKEKFDMLFSNIADYICIENISNHWEELDYSFLDLQSENTKHICGYQIKDIKVCYYPFYMLAIDKLGFVYPCCHMYDNFYLNNINDNDLYEIWNGINLKNLRIKLLKNNIKNIKVCSNCNRAEIYYTEYDYLDDSIDYLLDKYQTRPDQTRPDQT